MVRPIIPSSGNRKYFYAGLDLPLDNLRDSGALRLVQGIQSLRMGQVTDWDIFQEGETPENLQAKVRLVMQERPQNFTSNFSYVLYEDGTGDFQKI